MKVWTTYDSTNNTWNIMCGNDCLAYFHELVIENCKLDAIDKWLLENPKYTLED